MTLRVGLIGAGGVGEIRARALARSPGCALVAVADPDRERAARAAGPARAAVFASHTELLAAGGVDAVVVSTRPPLHEQVTVDALDAGAHVLCEKPLSHSAEGARRMLLRARERGRILATGFNHRYFPPIQRVKRAVESGEIGELDHVRAFAGHTGMAELKEPWLTDPAVTGGGALMDNGIHLLDLTRYVLGEVQEVSGLTSERVWNIDGCEDNGVALLRSSEGRIATLHASWTEWRGYRFQLAAYGTRGMAWAYYAPLCAMVVTLDRPGGRPRRRYHLYPRENLMEKLRSWKWTVLQTFVEELADFRARVEGNAAGAAGKAAPLADGFAGFRAVEMAQAIRQSSAEGRVVRLSEAV